MIKNYKFLFLLLFGLFIFIPKDTFAKQTMIRYYDENFKLLVTTGDLYYSHPISNVRYIRVVFNDQIKSGSSYISSYDFTISSESDYAWIYWDGNSGVNINGLYRATNPSSARTIKQDIGPVGDYLKRSYLTFKFNSSVTTTSSFFQLDLGSPREILYFELNNYNLTETSNAETDSIINGFDNLNSNNAKNTQDIIDNQNKNQKETNEKLDDIDDSLKDSYVSGANDDASGFFNDFESDDFGLSSIITMPLQFIQGLSSSTCYSLNLPLPFVDTNVTLPCMTIIYQRYFGDFLTLYQIITTGFIAYGVCINIFRLVQGFKNPDNDNVEVMEL